MQSQVCFKSETRFAEREIISPVAVRNIIVLATGEEIAGSETGTCPGEPLNLEIADRINRIRASVGDVFQVWT